MLLFGNFAITQGFRRGVPAAGSGCSGQARRLTLIRPARKDEKQPRYFPNWLRQRVEAIIWTLKHQLASNATVAASPVGLWARIVQRLLALNACTWHNWLIGAPVKRS
jgi:hypothetical protein